MRPRFDKTDCFAYSQNEFTNTPECSALITMICKYKDTCPFYITKARLVKKIRKYGGEMWWKKDGED